MIDQSDIMGALTHRALAFLFELPEDERAQAMLALAWEIASESDGLLEHLAELAGDAKMSTADMLEELVEARTGVRVQWGADAGVRPDQREDVET